MRLDPWLVRIIVGAVVVGWLGALTASIVNPDYQPPESLNALFLALAGSALALRNHNGNSGPKGGDPE